MKKFRNRLFKSLHSVFCDRSGNVVILAAVATLPMLAMAGGSIDIYRAVTTHAKLQSALDAGTLAAAALNNPHSFRVALQEHIETNVPVDGYWTTLAIDTVSGTRRLNQREVTVTASVTVPAIFLQLVGQEEIVISAVSTATQAVTNIELALAIDVSSSMGGSKIANLRVAAKDFIDEMLTGDRRRTTSFNLIPFGGTVNIGSLFNDLVVPTSTARINPTAVEYEQNRRVPHFNFRFADGENCVEVRRSDFTLALIPSGSRAQVPHFWRFRAANPWCPRSGSAAIFNSNDADDLKDRIDDITLSDGTGMDIGMLWGSKVLSPAWRSRLGGDFTDRPADFDDVNTQKVLVLMSDGDITSQIRPLDYTHYSTHSHRPPSLGTAFSSRGVAVDNLNRQFVLRDGLVSNPPGFPSTIGNFKSICEQIKAERIQVFTIGFAISRGSIADELLQNCATSVSHYFFVETLDIGTAFATIAARISNLRVTE